MNTTSASDIAALGSQPVQNLVEEYNTDRRRLLDDESALAFDHRCKMQATAAEKLADAVIQRLKGEDQKNVFDRQAPRQGYGNQDHPRFAGDHFLTNEELISKTQLLRVAREMPKGAHLHIHFNACLHPTVLLNVAKGMERMFIMSSLPLTGTSELLSSKIQLSILSREKENPGDLFSAAYEPFQTMQFQKFLDCFPVGKFECLAMDWLVSKLQFGEQETYDVLQTSRGAWERFNGRTQMMKGLFNYKTAYKEYTRLFLQDLLNDNIQYAEIRPNFMMTNQLWNDDGTQQSDNKGIVEIIIAECEAFKAQQMQKPGQRHFDGIKIIYCTPRSFSPEQVQGALDECLTFKQLWPDYIAGFDLVGEEAKGNPLGHFVPQFLAFKEQCRRANITIPFLFHCGETLDKGTEVDGNLADALLLGSKRIGHGFALPHHPHILKEMKQRGVCVEVCPISNELLGLTPRISGHSVYNLLANNMPCTINSDNGTLFRSTLSHDFYQIMVGKADMGLFGWRQLAEWSLEHACLSADKTADGQADEQTQARRHWLTAWRQFVVWLLETYDAHNPETQAVLAEIRANEAEAAAP